MAEFPALPLFTDAYLADTRHLTTEEHGAYLLLLMEAWRRPNCDLPDNDQLLSRLTGLPMSRWLEVKLIVMGFWKRDGRSATFKQKRLSAERTYVAGKTKVAKDAAARRWNKKKKCDANALQTECQTDAPTPTPTPTPSSLRSEDGGGGSACADEAEISTSQDPTIRERILSAMGVGPDGVAGPSKFIGGQGDMAEVGRWLEMPGLTIETVEAEICAVMAKRTGGAPSTFSYFTPAMQRLSARLSAPPLQPIADQQVRASPRSNLDAIAAKMQAEFAAKEAAK